MNVSLVVSDSSPVRCLAELGLLPLLLRMYTRVVIPPRVLAECKAPRKAISEPALNAIIQLEVVVPFDQAAVRALQHTLHGGESEAIELAIQLHADWLLVDDLKARQVAKAKHLNVIGVVGVLMAARSNGHILSISPLLRRLQMEQEFWIAPHLLSIAAQGDPP